MEAILFKKKATKSGDITRSGKSRTDEFDDDVNDEGNNDNFDDAIDKKAVEAFFEDKDEFEIMYKSNDDTTKTNQNF